MAVAREDVAQVLKRAQQREEKEELVGTQLRQGKTTLELYNFSELLEREGLEE